MDESVTTCNQVIILRGCYQFGFCEAFARGIFLPFRGHNINFIPVLSGVFSTTKQRAQI